jgi:signal transduction histidine kinase
MLAAASYGCSNTAELMNAGKIDAASQTLKTAQTAVGDAIAGLREALTDLRRSAVEEGGLMETVQKFADQLSTLWGARIVIEGNIEKEPPAPVVLAAFQILQEGLVNALKHSNSEVVTVTLGEVDGMLHITVEDEGVGFEDEPTSPEGHMGMRLMKERAEGVGGSIELRSRAGRGTRVEAVLPAGVPAA